MALDLGVDSDFLLVKDGLLGSQVVILAINLVLLLDTLDVVNLARNPVFLHISCLVIDFLNLLLDIVAHVLGWALVLITVASALQIGTFTVQTIDLQGLLLDLEQAILDALLDLHHVGLLLLKLANQVIQLLLQHVVLRLRVQVIEADSGDFVRVVLNLDLLLRDVFVGNLGLFEQVGRRLLNGLLLTGVADNIVANRLGLGVQLHDRLVDDIIL